jgi:uncharacterized protein (TIGR00255 family)
MIYSMTGYAAAACAVKGGALQIELKSVNSRYLDYHFRVCDELRIAEPALRELIGARLVRGKLECRVSFVATASAAQQASLNADCSPAWAGSIRRSGGATPGRAAGGQRRAALAGHFR